MRVDEFENQLEHAGLTIDRILDSRMPHGRAVNRNVFLSKPSLEFGVMDLTMSPADTVPLRWTSRAAVAQELVTWVCNVGAAPGHDVEAARRILRLAIELGEASQLRTLATCLHASIWTPALRGVATLAQTQRSHELSESAWLDLADTALESMDAADDDKRFDATAAEACVRALSRVPDPTKTRWLDQHSAERAPRWFAALAHYATGTSRALTHALLLRWADTRGPRHHLQLQTARALVRIDGDDRRGQLRAAIDDPRRDARVTVAELRMAYGGAAPILQFARALDLPAEELASVLGHQVLADLLEQRVLRAAAAWPPLVAAQAAYAEGRIVWACVRARVKGGFKVALLPNPDPSSLGAGFLPQSAAATEGARAESGHQFCVRILKAERSGGVVVRPTRGVLPALRNDLVDALLHAPFPVRPACGRAMRVLSQWSEAGAVIDRLEPKIQRDSLLWRRLQWARYGARGESNAAPPSTPLSQARLEVLRAPASLRTRDADALRDALLRLASSADAEDRDLVLQTVVTRPDGDRFAGALSALSGDAPLRPEPTF